MRIHTWSEDNAIGSLSPQPTYFSRSHLPTVEHVLAHVAKQRHGLFIGCFLPSHHEGEVAVLSRLHTCKWTQAAQLQVYTSSQSVSTYLVHWQVSDPSPTWGNPTTHKLQMQCDITQLIINMTSVNLRHSNHIYIYVLYY